MTSPMLSKAHRTKIKDVIKTCPKVTGDDMLFSWVDDVNNINVVHTAKGHFVLHRHKAIWFLGDVASGKWSLVDAAKVLKSKGLI